MADARFWDAAFCAALHGLVANADAQNAVSGNGSALVRMAAMFADTSSLERERRIEAARAKRAGGCTENIELMRRVLFDESPPSVVQPQ